MHTRAEAHKVMCTHACVHTCTLFLSTLAPDLEPGLGFAGLFATCSLDFPGAGVMIVSISLAPGQGQGAEEEERGTEIQRWADEAQSA
jgi:hypothetical protein